MPVHLKYRLGNVETDSCDRLHAWLLRIVEHHLNVVSGDTLALRRGPAVSEADSDEHGNLSISRI